MTNIEWLEGNRIKVAPPKKTKKCTGTRFASILGLNVWSTPFQMWCEITKTYEKPFEDTIYTIAGKTIEPKQADYVESIYGMDIIRPTDVYGADPFKATWGDFFRDKPIYGGMWDYLLKDETGKVTAVLEMKTTKRAEDWRGGEAPSYYSLQAALYAKLLGVDKVYMVASFLKPEDYEHPEQFEPNVENTIIIEFNVSELYPDFDNKIAEVNQWWKDHVETGISPEYDEKRDAEYLKALRTNSVSADTTMGDLVHEAEGLVTELNEVKSQLKEKQDRLDLIQKTIKEKLQADFRDGDKTVEISGSRYKWVVSKSSTTGIDKEALKADGLLEKYSKSTTQYRMTVKEV